MDVTVLVPAKSCSTRCRTKNTRPFFRGLSLLDVKVRQLKQVFDPADIVVSSDNQDVLEHIRSEGVRLHRRALDYRAHEYSWQDTFRHVLETLDAGLLLIAFVTTPFVTARAYRDAFELYRRLPEGLDSLLAVSEVRAKLLDAAGQPLNFGLGADYRGSPELAPIYAWRRGLSIIEASLGREQGLDLGRNPYLYKLDWLQSIDIDWDKDWECARNLCERAPALLEITY